MLMKIKLLSPFFLAVLIIIGLLVIAFPFSLAQSGTNVSGILSQDTTWTQAGSPYTLTGNILVDYGATLTIQTGATVNLGTYYYIRVNGSLIVQPGVTINMPEQLNAIQVNGVLTAIGTSNNPIQINGKPTLIGGNANEPSYNGLISFSPSSQSNSVIENASINNVIIEANNGITFANNEFSSGKLLLYGGASEVVNSNISAFVATDASPTISNNRITESVDVSGYDTAVISNNVLTGITLDNVDSDGSLLIERNLITNDSYGGIAFTGNYYGNLVIRNNTITNNAWGLDILDVNSQNIVYNNIYDNSINVKLEEPESRDVNLTNNWWGTTDQSAISNTFIDYNKDFNLGKVNFTPFLTAANPEAMPNLNAITTTASTPTSTTSQTQSSSTSAPQAPEFPSAPTVVIVILAVTATALLVRRKRAA
jgi:hypothetical protein